MSDPVMAGLKGIFGNTDGADDDTTATARPAATRRGLGQLLDDPAPPPVAATVETEEPAAPTKTESPQALPATRTPAPSASSAIIARRQPATPDVNERPSVSSRKKTSLTLPGSVRARTVDAYERRRWTFAELVEEGLRRLQSRAIGEQTIERTLGTFQRGDTTSTKTVLLANDVLEQLDDYAGRWRLSRSQLVAAVLVDVTDSLG